MRRLFRKNNIELIAHAHGVYAVMINSIEILWSYDYKFAYNRYKLIKSVNNSDQEYLCRF